MLFRADILSRIATGEITVAFRCWRRPTVQAETRLHTPVGVLRIRAVEPIDPARITDADARRSGAADAESVRQDLAREAWRGGIPYRIRFSRSGDDPRIALRQRQALSIEECQELSARLDRLDQRAADGPWTKIVLRAIQAAPDTHARMLASALGWKVDQLKRRVRTLKNLGLTESLPAGYRLSPRGRSVLAKLAP